MARKGRATESKLDASLQFYRTTERHAARYSSATTVCEEALDHGRWIGLYWSASGHAHRENVVAKLPGLDLLQCPLNAFELEADGQSLHNRWTWVGSKTRAGQRPGTQEGVVELRHQVRPVSLRVVTRVDGSPILARYLEITNTGSVPMALNHVAPWAGVLWQTNTQQALNPRVFSANPSWAGRQATRFRVGYLAGNTWGREGDFAWQPVPPETLRIERKAGRNHGSPYFILRNEVTGELFFLGLAWSGNHFAEFSEKQESLFTFRIGLVGPTPLRVVAPGETVLSPEVHLGPLHGNTDQAVAAWHQHVRSSVMPRRAKGKEMYTIAGRVVEEPGEWILREMDIAAEMGVEAFMIDAGWYGNAFAEWPENRGDWQEGSWMPGGMAGCRNYARRKGMMFGLWHEAEAISPKSRLFEKHPDWVLKSDDLACGNTLNLAIPEAARFLEEQILRIVRDYKLDFYKLDYNVRVSEGGQTLRDGYAEGEAWRHYEALHRAYDRVRREHPGVCLENCGGGGGRNDLSMVSRFDYSCESDWSVFPYSIRAINAMTLFIPPEGIAYYHNHIQHAHQTADLDTHLRVTLFCLPIFVGFGAQNADRSTQVFQRMRRYIDLHKGFCRPVLAGQPVVYHHTPDIGLLRPADWCVLEYGRPDRSRGYAGVFQLSGAAPDYRLRLRGVNAASEYEVLLDNDKQVFRAAGRDLLNDGLPLRLDSPLTSELVMYRAVKS